DHLRLLFARIGRPHCPVCDAELGSTTPARLSDDLLSKYRDARLHVLAPVSIETGRDRELRDTLARLVRQGFTRAFAGGVELRLDEEDPGDVLRRVLDRLQAARAEVGDDGEAGGVGEPLRDPDGGSASARDEESIPPIESLLGEVSPDEIRAAERAAAALKDPRAKGLLV